MIFANKKLRSDLLADDLQFFYFFYYFGGGKDGLLVYWLIGKEEPNKS
jgi:hypothetical protein